jgi:hypothetical protein
MEKQRTSAPYPQIMGRVLRQGLKGWLAGFWPWGFVLGATKGSVLGGSRAFFLKQLEDAQVPRARADLISGFLAGAVQGVAMSPILLARTRVNQSLTERAAAAAATGGVIRTGFMAEMAHSSTILNQAIKQEGVGLLFKGARALSLPLSLLRRRLLPALTSARPGMPAMVFKRAMDWGTRFIFIKQFTDMATRAKPAGVKLSDPERLALSFCGGAASVAVTMPVDRLMPIIQQASAGNEGECARAARRGVG